MNNIREGIACESMISEDKDEMNDQVINTIEESYKLLDFPLHKE